MPPTQSDSAVAELQRVLTAYANATGYAAANPGTVDGVIGIKTTLAVVALLPKIPGLPQEVRSLAPLIALMLATDDGRTQAFDLIKRNASAISGAIIAMAAYQATQTPSGGPPTNPGTTPTSRSIRAGTLYATPANVFNSVIAPPTVAPTPDGAGVPTNPSQAIWFFDRFSAKYRMAVPRVGLSGTYVDYIEVAPASSRPTFGVEVTRSTFMGAIGKWWATPGGIALLVGAALGIGGVTYVGVRALTR